MNIRRTANQIRNGLQPRPLSPRARRVWLAALTTFTQWVVFALLCAPVWGAEAGAARLYSGEYSLACWLNGWRKHPSDTSPEVLAIQASRYAFTLKLADFTKAGYEPFTQQPEQSAASYRDALGSGTERLYRLPAADVRITLEVDGTSYTARSCAAGTDRDPRRLGAAKMWESGRFVQHFELEGLKFEDGAGQPLPVAGSLFVVAWPDSLTLTASVRPPAGNTWKTLRLQVAFKGQDLAEVAEQCFEGPHTSDGDRRVSLTVGDTRHHLREPADRISVQVTYGANTLFPVAFDAVKNCYTASVPRVARTFKGGYTDIRDYDDFSIAVENRAEAEAEIPFLLEFRNPANITGLCPILCDKTGRPTGIPVQLSKNWHHGEYLMGYTRLPARPGRSEYLLRIAYGFYGSLPSASHSQLSLIGYSPKGGNGRWDQLAIGCWGETFCLDMDLSLVDIVATDVRMLMARNGTRGTMWSWTDAGWGGDWLSITNDAGEKAYFRDLQTAYLSQGPCLTDVRYDGYYGSQREVGLKARVQTLRTDDYARTFHTLSYTFRKPVSARGAYFFMQGRTGQYATPVIAYGNKSGLIAERRVPGNLKPKACFVDHLTLEGAGPWWVSFPGASTTDKRDWGNGYRALVIRSYRANFGGKSYDHPTISLPLNRMEQDLPNLNLELVAPEDVALFAPGDSVELVAEWITLPRAAEDYYGPNEAFRNHLTENPKSWQTTYREAAGNDLSVQAAGGSVLCPYPIQILCSQPEVEVTVAGGVGFVPVSFEGLPSVRGRELYQVVDGKEIKFSQEVHGNDFWQVDHDEGSRTYRLTYNLPLDGKTKSAWRLRLSAK